MGKKKTRLSLPVEKVFFSHRKPKTLNENSLDIIIKLSGRTYAKVNSFPIC